MAKYMSRVSMFRETVDKVVTMLTERGLKVTQQGVRAYVSYDKKTGLPITVNIPAIPEKADDKFLDALRGFIDHECAHVLFTDGAYATKTLNEAKDKHLQAMFNIVEDVRIERCMMKEFAGSANNISNTWDWLYQSSIDPSVKSAKNDNEFMGAILPTLIHAIAGKEPCMRYLNENPEVLEHARPLLDALRVLKDDLEGEIASTADAIDIAARLLKVLREGMPKPPPSGGGGGDSEPDDSDESGESSEDSSQEKQGKTEQKPKPKSKPKSDPSDEGEDDDASDEDSSDDNKDSSSDKDDSAFDSNDEFEESESDNSGSSEDEKEASDEDKEEQSDASDEGEGEGSDGDEDSDEDGEGDADSDSADSGDVEDQSDSDGEDGDGDGNGDGDEAGNGEDQESDEGSTGEPLGERDAIGDALMNNVTDFEDKISDALAQVAKGKYARGEYIPYTRDFDRFLTVTASQSATTQAQTFAARMDEDMRMTVGQMANHFRRIFAQRDFSVNVGGQRRGRIQASALHRLRVNDDRVFFRREEHNAMNTAVGLLIDCSGSMEDCDKISLAMESAFAFSQTLDRVGIAHEVLGFTTRNDATVNDVRFDYNKLSEEVKALGRSFSRLEAINMLVFKEFDEAFKRIAWRFSIYHQASGLRSNRPVPTWANVDGESVEYACNRLLRRPEQRKVLIVLSDGQPASGGALNSQLQDHLRDTVQKAESLGVETLGIGIMDESVKHFYPKNTVIRSASELPSTVMREMSKILLK